MQSFQPGAEIIHEFSYSSMRGSDYLLKENKMEAMEPFFTSGNQRRERIAF
jgi:hypothetical protein